MKTIWLMLGLLGLTSAAWADTASRDLSAFKEEPVPGGALLVVAYAVMWLLLAGLVGRLVVRQGQLEREIKALEQRLERGA